jgi:hypothetical protein
MAQIGDLPSGEALEDGGASKKVGQEVRRGTVTKVSGVTMLTVRWVSGGESMFVPGPGAVDGGG